MKNIIKKSGKDLFSFPIFNFIFKNKIFLFLIRLFITFIFFYAIFLGFIYPVKEENAFTTALFWSLFWSFFMVLSLSTLGRVFCGICPHGFIGKYLTTIGLNKKIPKKLANPFIGLSVILGGYWLLIFLFPGIYRVPFNTSVFFLILTILSFLFFFVYKEMAYCKYICPLGTVTKVFSKISFMKLETYKEGCSSCKTFDCATACNYNLKPFTFNKKNSMEDCTLCMDCATSCENVAFTINKPSSSLLNKFKVQKVEVWTLLILTAILSFSMTIKHGLNRTAIADEFIWNKISSYIKSVTDINIVSIDGMTILFFTVFTILILNIVGMLITSKLIKVDYEKTFYTLSYALIPLFIIGGLAHILEFFFLHYASNIFNGFNEAFHLGLNPIEPLAKRGEAWLLIFKVFPHIAYLWAFILMFNRLKLLNDKINLRILAFPFASIVIISYMSLNFYAGYVFKTYGVKKTNHHTSLKHEHNKKIIN